MGDRTLLFAAIGGTKVVCSFAVLSVFCFFTMWLNRLTSASFAICWALAVVVLYSTAKAVQSGVAMPVKTAADVIPKGGFCPRDLLFPSYREKADPSLCSG
jgi:hypothetical protein